MDSFTCQVYLIWQNITVSNCKKKIILCKVHVRHRPINVFFLFKENLFVLICHVCYTMSIHFATAFLICLPFTCFHHRLYNQACLQSKLSFSPKFKSKNQSCVNHILLVHQYYFAYLYTRKQN